MSDRRKFVAVFWLTKSGPEERFYHETAYCTQVAVIREIAEDLEGVSQKDVHIIGIHEQKGQQQ